ncbi:pyridoxal phosphate-dependent transferase [Mrakia frigida]|uniref:kynureninase n=1 Tax=Mrakia frigida TaxID=29902 RepID=UPI003FCC1981
MSTATISSLLSTTGLPLTSSSFASHLDSLPLNHQTGLTSTRDLYEIPTRKEMGAEGGDAASPAIYMAGNSLGLLPKETKVLINEELDVWGSRAVLGHFSHPQSRPWKSIDETVTPSLASIVGAASSSEVACTSTLTSNLHNLFVTFYQPEKEGKRKKILMEGKAFPSDQYAVQSHLDLHGLSLEEGLIELDPREGEGTLRTEDVLRAIEEQGEEIALVWFSGVQYYSGQVFDLEAITKAGQAKGCIVGFDLAHAVGNVTLKLHDWGVDFAVWCHYKYLNAGPGAVAGLFVHSKWEDQTTRPRLSGWWGHAPSTRFSMPSTFQPIPGAQGYQHSNPPLLSLIPLIASLNTIDLAGGFPALRERSKLLTGYLLALLKSSPRLKEGGFSVITPLGENEGFDGNGDGVEARGAQLSLRFEGVKEGERGGRERMKRVFEGLVRKGVMGDEREPEVIRFAPIPLYTTFEEVRMVAVYLEEVLQEEEDEEEKTRRS